METKGKRKRIKKTPIPLYNSVSGRHESNKPEHSGDEK